MKNWEDIIKDRLEGYESPLPESSLAEFRALRDGKEARTAKKISPWIWGFAAAVAAGLAAVMFLRNVGTDTIEILEPVPAPQRIAQAVPPEAVRQIPIRTREVIRKDQPVEDIPVAISEEESDAPVTTVEVPPEPETEETKDAAIVSPASPFISENTHVKPRTIKVGPAVGAIAGSGLLAAVITPVFKAGTLKDNLPVNIEDQAGKPDSTGIGYDFSNIDPSANPTELIGGFQDEVLMGSPKHYFPLKLGLSTRIPVAGQVYVTTGLQYSLYSSSYTFSSSGEIKQQAHYLGIPVRMDWVFASGGMLDAYVGGGVQGDLCVRATLGGASLPKDGLSLSLLGAGGIQMNVTKHLGLYVEPELSWRIPSEKHVLQTYRSEHPLMFSVAAGLRINMGK